MELSWNTIQLEGLDEQQLGMELAQRLKAHPKLAGFGGEKAGIYLVTSAAGGRSSAELWANALENSPRFANPGIFPWTLANAPASLLARELNAQGPNYTIIDGDHSKENILQLAQTDVQSGLANSAILVQYNLCSDTESLSCSWAIL